MKRSLSPQTGAIAAHGETEVAEVLKTALRVSVEHAPDVLTHGFHTYPARMHPGIAGTLLRASMSEGLVVDPFCGSGTTAVETRLFGRPFVGTDLSPLALRLAEVKSRSTTRKERERFLRVADAVVEANKDRVRGKEPSHAPLSPHDVQKYDAHVLKELAGLREEISLVKNNSQRWALEMVFSSLVIKFSRLRSDTSDERVQKRIGRFVPTEFFGRKAQELVNRWADFADELESDSVDPRYILGDARALPNLLGDQRAKLIITSPPYGGTYDYQSHHALRMAWLGLNDRRLVNDEIGSRRRFSESSSPDEALAAWDDEVAVFLEAMWAALQPGGHAFILMGDGEVAGQRVPAGAQLRRLSHAENRMGGRWTWRATASVERADARGGFSRAEHLVALMR